MHAPKETELSPLTRKLSEYVGGALDAPLPDGVVAKTKSHILDTFAAMVSGSQLKVGRLATAFALAQGGRTEATLIGASERVPAISAALANGMSGHADETDDSHLRGRGHPGCAVLPAAFAAAEVQDASGDDLIRAVTVGYDMAVRAVLSLGFTRSDTLRHSSHSLGAVFGATAAAAALYRLDAQGVRHAFSYAAQQASGIPFWQRDYEHVEKAFDFGGMGARNGMTAVAMVAAGFSAVEDPFTGRFNFFDAFAETADPEAIAAELGSRYEILDATIKKWCVGSPIQSVLDATTALVEAHCPLPDDFTEVVVTVPDDRIHIIDDRSMPAVCVQHLVALALTDGTVTFESTHDVARMSDPAIVEMRRRIRLVPSAELTAARPARQAIVELVLTNGTRLRCHATAVRGTPDNPMDITEIKAKATDLLRPILGAGRTRDLISAVLELETLPSVHELRPMLMVAD